MWQVGRAALLCRAVGAFCQKQVLMRFCLLFLAGRMPRSSTGLITRRQPQLAQCRPLPLEPPPAAGTRTCMRRRNNWLAPYPHAVRCQASGSPKQTAAPPAAGDTASSDRRQPPNPASTCSTRHANDTQSRGPHATNAPLNQQQAHTRTCSITMRAWPHAAACPRVCPPHHSPARPGSRGRAPKTAVRTPADCRLHAAATHCTHATH